MREMETLRFTVTGDFVTRIAREWLYYDRKPYETSEELLLSAMCGTDLSEGELKKMAQEILLGHAELRGDSNNGVSFIRLNAPSEMNIFTAYSNVCKEEKEIRAKYDRLQRKYTDLCNAIMSASEECFADAIEEIKNEDDKSMFCDLLQSLGVLRRVIYPSGRQELIFNDDDTAEMEVLPKTGDSLVDSYLKAQRFDDNYGWLSPSGEFTPVEWSGHQEWAYDQIRKCGLDEEFEKWEEEHPLRYAGDFWCSKGWILLHNPGQGVAKVTRDPEKRITKAQAEFLYEYYTKRGENEKAKEFLS